MKSNDFVVKGYSRVRKFLFPVHLICIGSIKTDRIRQNVYVSLPSTGTLRKLTMRFNPMVKMRL